MSPESTRRFWEGTAARLAYCVNVAAWLDRFAPASFVTATATAISLYALRRADGAAIWGWLFLGVALFAAGFVAWRLARHSFFERAEARIFLEFHLRLDTRLTAAAAGLAPWPERPATKLPRLVRWHAPATFAWMIAAFVLVLGGVMAPLPAIGEEAARPVEKPPSLAQAEAWIERLQQLEVATPEAVDRLAERARELAQRSPEDQYTHSGLEAADALRDQTAAGLENLARGFDLASDALAPFQSSDGTLTDEELKALSSQLDAALRGLREGSLSANADLLKNLPAGAEGLKSLSPEQAAQLRQRMADAGRSARGVCGAAGDEADVAGADGERVSRNGSRTGAGGVKRGPGQAPLMFSDTASDSGPGRTESVSNEDFARAALGDLLGTARGEHERAPDAAGPVSAGAVAAPGTGGEAVWVNRLTPAERATLKDFFK